MDEFMRPEQLMSKLRSKSDFQIFFGQHRKCTTLRNHVRFDYSAALYTTVLYVQQGFSETCFRRQESLITSERTSHCELPEVYGAFGRELLPIRA